MVIESYQLFENISSLQKKIKWLISKIQVYDDNKDKIKKLRTDEGKNIY